MLNHLCTFRVPEFEPKKLNREIEAALATRNSKKDSCLAELQKLAGSQLMATGTALTLLMSEEECDKMQFVKLLNDVAKLAISIHHAVSVSRRANIYIPNLSPKVADLIKKAEMDDNLFGSDLSERIKESKALSKLTEEIKTKPKETNGKKPFFWKGQPRRKPLAQQQGQNNNKGQYKQQPHFGNKQHHFNSNQKKSEENASQK